MRRNNTRTVGLGTALTTVVEEFDEFDRLPADLREIANYAPIKIASRPLNAAVARYGQEEAADRALDYLLAKFPDWKPV